MTKDELNGEQNKSNMNANLASYHKPMNSTMLQSLIYYRLHLKEVNYLRMLNQLKNEN